MSVKIGITGHRRLLEPDNIKEEIKKNIQEILREKHGKDFEGYSALAAGADILFAELVVELHGKLHVVLPFEQKEYEKDFTDKELYKFREILYKSSDTTSLKGNNVANKNERNKAYLACGKNIIDTCDVVITAWDGEKADGQGGTGDIVEYARAKNKEIKIITAFQNELQKIKDLRDRKAIYFQRKYEKRWITCLLTGISVAILLALGIALKHHLRPRTIAVIAAIDFILIIVLVRLIFQLDKGHLKRNRIINRREAERLRVIEKLNKGKLQIKPLDNNGFISQEVKNIEENYIAETHSGNSTALGKEKLMDLIKEQLDYHKNIRPKKNNHVLEGLEKAQQFLLIAFILFAALDVYNNFMHSEKGPENLILPEALLIFCNLIIPPIYAGIEGFIFFKEFRRNKNDSAVMCEFFSAQQNELAKLDPASPTAKDELIEMANRIRNKMDEENLNWAVTADLKRAPGP